MVEASLPQMLERSAPSLGHQALREPSSEPMIRGPHRIDGATMHRLPEILLEYRSTAGHPSPRPFYVILAHSPFAPRAQAFGEFLGDYGHYIDCRFRNNIRLLVNDLSIRPGEHSRRYRLGHKGRAPSAAGRNRRGGESSGGHTTTSSMIPTPSATNWTSDPSLRFSWFLG